MGSLKKLIRSNKPDASTTVTGDTTGVNAPNFKKDLNSSKGRRHPDRVYNRYDVTNKQEHIKPMEAPMRPKKGTDATEGSAVVNSGSGSSASVAGEAQYVQADTSIGDVRGGGSIRRKKGLSSVLGVM